MAKKNGKATAKTSGGIFDGFVGRYCICRGSAAGVHAGTVKAIQTNADGTNNVVLTGSRRLWQWKANSGIALSGVSQSGIDRSKSKVDTRVGEHAIIGVCEIIPCADAAKESINGA